MIGKIIKAKKGIVSVEYALLIFILVTAFLGMTLYFKRSFCGKWRNAADIIGSGMQFVPNGGTEFDYYVDGNLVEE